MVFFLVCVVAIPVAVLGLGAHWTKPSEDPVHVTGTNCKTLECEAEGGLVGWDYGTQPDGTHTLFSDKDFTHELCFVNVSVTFAGNRSELTVCATEKKCNGTHILFLDCFAYNSTKREPSEARPSNLVRIEAYGLPDAVVTFFNTTVYLKCRSSDTNCLFLIGETSFYVKHNSMKCVSHKTRDKVSVFMIDDEHNHMRKANYVHEMNSTALLDLCTTPTPTPTESCYQQGSAASVQSPATLMIIIAFLISLYTVSEK